MEKYRASFLTFIFGNYEVVHEVTEKTPNCQYVLVTDNPSLTSSTWEVKCIENKYPDDPFAMCLDIRYHPFDYVDSDVVVRLDGSMEACGDLTHVLDMFDEGGYDALLTIHPSRSTIYDERVAWVRQRGMDVNQANKVLNFLVGMEGYDVQNYKMLIQMNLQIWRNNKVNSLANEMTLSYVHYLSEDGKVAERCDQDIYSFVIAKYFSKMKILPVSQNVSTSGKYFKWYAHNSNTPLKGDSSNFSQPYLFNQPIDALYVGE